MTARFRQAQGGALAVGMAVRSVEVRNSRELALELATMDHKRPDALLILADPLTTSERLRIVEFAAAQRLPAMYETSRFVEAGGLMSYGPNLNRIVRRAATYVDKILRGAKPGDLAIEQPATFELMLNLKSAKAQGITIPQSMLLQADRVIE
jgi:putative ABC transport system substrate-binding protein